MFRLSGRFSGLGLQGLTGWMPTITSERLWQWTCGHHQLDRLIWWGPGRSGSATWMELLPATGRPAGALQQQPSLILVYECIFSAFTVRVCLSLAVVFMANILQIEAS